MIGVLSRFATLIGTIVNFKHSVYLATYTWLFISLSEYLNDAVPCCMHVYIYVFMCAQIFSTKTQNCYISDVKRADRAN